MVCIVRRLLMRRSLFATVAFLLVFPLLAQQQPPAPAPAPAEAKPDFWAALMTGNRQFVAGTITYDKLKEERQFLHTHQMPPITVLSCSDSRLPPELLFNQSLGALFVVRSAGNVADEFGIASIEYAIAQGYTQLIVVLGHDNCGAVAASLGPANPATPALNALATRIRSSFVGVRYDARDAANVKKAIEANTRSAAAQLLAGSTLIRDAVSSQRIPLVTAYYDLETGVVTKLE
jgi:carbonic anhydrase